MADGWLAARVGLDGREVQFRRSIKLPPDTAFVTWAEQMLARSRSAIIEQLSTLYAAGVPISEDDYVYLANDEQRAQTAAALAPLSEVERDRLVNGDWSLPEAPPMTTTAANDPASEAYRQAAFKTEWAELIALFRMARDAGPMSTEAVRKLAPRLASHGMPSYSALLSMDATSLLDALAPIRMLAPPPDPRFGPMVAADNERMARAQYAAMRDGAVSAMLRSQL